MGTITYNKVLKTIINKGLLRNDNAGDQELTIVGKQFFGDDYIGTFPSDKIPKKNGYMIVNLDNSSQGGSHWIALYQKNGKKYVYDSFGRKTKKILPSLKGGSIFDAEYDPEQGIREGNCGARSMSFLYVLDKLGLDVAMTI